MHDRSADVGDMAAGCVLEVPAVLEGEQLQQLIVDRLCEVAGVLAIVRHLGSLA
jgi:hypothetical protein